MFKDDDMPYDNDTFDRDKEAIRAARRTGLLSPEEIAEYEAAGFPWDPRRERFERMLSELETIYRKLRRCPGRSLDERQVANFEIGLGRKDPALLRKLRKKYGVKTRDEKVAEKLVELETFYRKHRRCPSSRRHEDRKLATFQVSLHRSNPTLLRKLREKYGVKTKRERATRMLVELRPSTGSTVGARGLAPPKRSRFSCLRTPSLGLGPRLSRSCGRSMG
jgi:hypothetical protein